MVRRPDVGLATLLPPVVTNLIPLVGVLALGWNADTLLVIYVFEIPVAAFWTAVGIPFARLRPNNAIDTDGGLVAPLQEKRGAVGTPGPLPPFYLRNLPSLPGAAMLGGLSFAAGFVAWGLTDPTITEEVALAVLLGTAGAFLAHGIETVVGFVRGDHREHSPRTMILPVYKRTIGVGVLMVLVLFGNAGEGTPFESRAVLALLVVGKLVYDLRELRIRLDDDRRGWFERLYGDRTTETVPEPVETPDGEPRRVVAVPLRVAVVDAVCHGLGYGFGLTGVFVWPVVALGVLGSAPSIAAFGLALGTVVGGVAGTTRYLSHGRLEYRLYDRELIVHDRLLGVAQGRLEYGAITDATVSRGVVDRLLGTETLKLDAPVESPPTEWLPDFERLRELGESEANASRPVDLVHVEDAAGLAEFVGRPVRE